MESLVIHRRQRVPAANILEKLLLFSGILASLLYVFANIICAISYEGYSSVSQTVSELSAIGAPTKSLWVSLMIPYSLLMIAFGWGVVHSASSNKKLLIVGILLLIDSVIGFFWPPMHQRDVLAAGGGTWTDTMHIAFTFIHVPLIMVAIGFGATAFGKKFRLYSIITLVALMIAGVFTGMDSPNVQKNLPTPWIGLWERFLIAVYMVWLAALAILLLRKHHRQLSNTLH
ncbi:MAG TPA: DUF998 domain-containing protein [Chitinophagaceae bacterium]|nr:DUF998 domain-containing protein [Chitinophagaceae bacterium]